MAKSFVKTAILQQSQPIVDKEGRAAAWFVRLINDNNGNVTEAINQLAALPEIQQALEQAQQAVVIAQEAAENAQQAADQAQQQTDATKREAALQGSYISPNSVLTATPTTITIAAHTRYYADGTSVGVSEGSVTATGAGDVDYVSYVDPGRTGGAVSYDVSIDPPTQTGDTHVIGAVTIPDTGSVSGGDGPLRPGYVRPQADIQ